MFYKLRSPFFAPEDDLGTGSGADDQDEKNLPDNPEDTEEPEEKQDKEDDIDWKAAFLGNKSEIRRLKKQLREVEDKSLDDDHRKKLEGIRNKAKEKGYDDDMADMFADTLGDLLKSVPNRRDPIDEEVADEIDDLVDEIPGIKKYKKEIIEKVKKYRKADPDFGVEDALKLISPKKADRSELRLEIEQKNALSRRNEESPAPKGTTGGVKDPYPLSADEKRILKQLQSDRPEKNWTAEKYYKLMKK